MHRVLADTSAPIADTRAPLADASARLADTSAHLADTSACRPPARPFLGKGELAYLVRLIWNPFYCVFLKESVIKGVPS